MALQTAMDTVANSVVYRKAQMEELKNALKGAIAEIKAQQAAEKALADIIPDVHKWHEQFTLSELGEVKNKVSAKLVQWEHLPLHEKLKKIENEINYVSDENFWKPHKIYPTWEVAVSAYKKQADIVNETLAWMPVDAELASIKAYSLAHPKSTKISQLILEAEKIKANGGTIAQVKSKIDEANVVKAKNDASVISKAKKEAEKKAKALVDLQQKKQDLIQKQATLSAQSGWASAMNPSALPQIKADLKAVEKELADVDKKIDKLGGGNPFTSDAYSDARKNAALWTRTKDARGLYDRKPGDDYFRPFAEKDWARWSQNEKEVAYNYTSGSSYINEPLYTKYLNTKYGVNGEVRNSWDDINTLTDMIDKSTPFTRDVWLNRGASAGEFFGQFGIRLDPNDPSSIVGAIGEQKPFMSTGHTKSWGFVDDGGEAKSPVVYNIYCPKGTKGIYTEPYSAFGSGGILMSDFGRFCLSNIL